MLPSGLVHSPTIKSTICIDSPKKYNEKEGAKKIKSFRKNLNSSTLPYISSLQKLRQPEELMISDLSPTKERVCYSYLANNGPTLIEEKKPPEIANYM